MSTDRRVAVMGAGMHPWGKWGRNFVEYGVVAARAALADAGIAWSDVQFVAGADTIRNGYPGFVSGATFAQALGWTGASVSSSYAACACGAAAIASARAQILAGLCDVALVVGADTTPKGFFAPVGGDRKDDPDWLRFRLLGASNPVYFALYARRRMELLRRHRRGLRAGQGEERAARREEPQRPLPRRGHRRGGARVADGQRSAAAAEHLRHLRRCGRPRADERRVRPRARPRRSGTPLVGIDAVSTVTPTFPNPVIEMPNFATDAGEADRRRASATRSRCGRTSRPGSSPQDVDVAEVYDLSSALELDWYENIGLCAEGEAENLLRSGATTLGGRVPVNPSGGLSCFGEAIPAQAIAQVCELVWQLRGQAGDRQVEGAKLGITANQGLFGNASSVIVSR